MTDARGLKIKRTRASGRAHRIRLLILGSIIKYEY